MIKILNNNLDSEIKFTSLNEAKNYYALHWDEKEERENFMGTDAEFASYKENFLLYIDELSRTNSFEELADVLNRYTDTFGNGSMWTVTTVE